MSNESNVEKFDPAQLMQGVKDRIKATFVSLIPDEQWEQMVKSEVDLFFKPRETGYQNRQYASDFQILVRDMLNKDAESRLKEYLKSKEFDVTWMEYGRPVASEAVRAMVIDNAGAILASFYSGMFATYLQQFTNNLRQY